MHFYVNVIDTFSEKINDFLVNTVLGQINVIASDGFFQINQQ